MNHTQLPPRAYAWPPASGWHPEAIMPAHWNLLAYAQAAKLPKMELSPAAPAVPPPERKSHGNRLAVEWEQYRRLERLFTISHFQDAAMEFCCHNVPAHKIGRSDNDDENGGGISIAVKPFATGRAIPIGKPSDIARVVRWVLEYPLATVSHMMHLVFPQTADFTIQEGADGNVDDNSDHEILRWATWALDVNMITEVQDTWTESVVIIIQPPWILSAADLLSFVKIPTVYDICSHKRSHWFVVTSYWGWVFGCFSQRRTRVYTSRVIPYDSAKPNATVVECLFFWFSCAMASQIHPPHAWIPPEVPEPLEDFELDTNADDIVADVQPAEDGDTPQNEPQADPAPSGSDGNNPNVGRGIFPGTAPSESSWNARSDARSHTPSGIESDEEEDARAVLLQLIPELAMPPRSHVVRSNMLPDDAHDVDNFGIIDQWFERVRSGQYQHTPFATQTRTRGSESVAGSALTFTTVTSVSTIREFADQDQKRGTWMSPQERNE
ncbi:hypothetical protein BN946_scf184798.g117 [Trametes cinnabarina]|uniref:Uncharacterized protein n=1 Tax=Pycnoporus cinnabarinus TaxID=5643 RepID=A0A060S9C6_PYCCI|nr:hypothetical protein BN946_scf184798.g117 [Trametes cinnabarina]